GNLPRPSVQDRPGHGPPPQIGDQQSPGGPPLQMLAENLPAVGNSMPGTPQPVAQLNVLNGRRLVGLVKAAMLQEDVPPDRPTGAPEGKRFLGGTQVDEMLE